MMPEDIDVYFKKKRQERLEELKKSHNCKEHSRCIKCTGGTDTYECRICGEVWEGPCNFDEDFS